MCLRAQKFVEVVFNIDTEKFFQLVDEGRFTDDLLVDTFIFDERPFPLHYITICWDVILSKYEEWKEEYRDVLRKRKGENDKMKEFFISKCGLDMKRVPFAEFCDEIPYCNCPDDTVEDIFGETKEALVEKGYRSVDVDLYCSTLKLDFAEVERLLKAGADSKKVIAAADDCAPDHIEERLGWRCADLEIDLEKCIFGEDCDSRNYRESISDLISLAAIETMLSLFSKHPTPPSD